MISKLKFILETIPLAELEDFYCDLYKKFYGKCDRAGLENHILGYLQIYLMNHKNNEKLEIKCYKILNWFQYMYDKYIKKED